MLVEGFEQYDAGPDFDHVQRLDTQSKKSDEAQSKLRLVFFQGIENQVAAFGCVAKKRLHRTLEYGKYMLVSSTLFISGLHSV